MIELLSPAGGRERLEYAIAYGADAVYMAGSGYSLRAFADNFTDSELSEAIKYAHIFGKKAYITTNIYAHNSDIDTMGDYIRRLAELGADAVLVADLGVLSLAKKAVPHMPVHISTQANITNYMAAQMAYDLGASRVVLARELSLDEIAQIHARVPKLELESFVHGAMCISYSGRCLLSNYLTDRGANQGKCVQACRWKYELLFLFGQTPQIFPCTHFLRRGILRKLISLKIEIKITSLCNPYRIFNSAVISSEKHTHFVGCLIIKLVGFKANRTPFNY